MKKILLCIPLLLLLTGCFNYREINDLAIVSGVSITKDGENIVLTTEVINPQKEQDTSSGEEPKYIIYTAKGKSVQEAIREMIKESPRKMYAAHLEILIIDEEIAKENLRDILDFFSRDPEIRSEFKVLVGKKKDILEITTPLEKISSKNILDSLEANANHLGYANLFTYHQVIDNILNPYIELALPVVTERGNEEDGQEKTNIEETKSDAASIITGMAIFKNNKLKGYLTKKESLAYNLIRNNAHNYLIHTNYKDNQYIVHEVINSSTKVDFDKKKNQIKISVKGTSALSEVKSTVNIEKKKTIEHLQTEVNQEIEQLITEAIANINQKYNSDIYGFADLIYKTDPKYFKSIQKEWYNKIFPNLEIKVISNIEIIEKGNLNGGLYDE